MYLCLRVTLHLDGVQLLQVVRCECGLSPAQGRVGLNLQHLPLLQPVGFLSGQHTTGVTQVSHRCHTVSHMCHTGVTQVSHRCHTGVTQVSHRCHTDSNCIGNKCTCNNKHRYNNNIYNSHTSKTMQETIVQVTAIQVTTSSNNHTGNNHNGNNYTGNNHWRVIMAGNNHPQVKVGSHYATPLLAT